MEKNANLITLSQIRIIIRFFFEFRADRALSKLMKTFSDFIFSLNTNYGQKRQYLRK